ncbi:MAG: hypothetical protein K0S47_4395 [Herbinix sp.]|jgi:uncharacterized membrane protein|nr:hypothetical protein [Herbinix sp.]
MREKIITALSLMIGLIFWILYLCDSEMSRYGIYTIFSYKTHEMMALIPFLSIIITAIWFLYKLIKIIKEKNIKSHLFLVILLFVLCTAQTNYILNESQTVVTSFVTSVERIETDKMLIVINSNGNDLILECPQVVLEVFKTDGTEYGITYEWNKRNPNHGKLCIAQCIN